MLLSCFIFPFPNHPIVIVNLFFDVLFCLIILPVKQAFLQQFKQSKHVFYYSCFFTLCKEKFRIFRPGIFFLYFLQTLHNSASSCKMEHLDQENPAHSIVCYNCYKVVYCCDQRTGCYRRVHTNLFEKQRYAGSHCTGYQHGHQQG